MNKQSEWRRGAGRLVVCCALAVLSGIFLPFEAYKDVTGELISFFSIMIAALLPTMVLTASVLRPGKLSSIKISQYATALSRQIAVWSGLFLICFIACWLLVLGKMVSWSLPITLTVYSVKHKLNLIRFINAALSFSFSLTIFRGAAVGSGIVSLLNLTAEIAIGEARARDEEIIDKASSQVAEIQDRPGFGEYISLPH